MPSRPRRRNRPTIFALKLREKRARAGKILDDQAKALRLSVSYISAIELGTRRVPDNYALDVANWLGLTESETAELCSLALQHDVAPQPKDADVPEDIRVAVAQLNELRARLALRPGKASDDDIKQLAILARAALGLGLNLVQIFEHRLPFVDPEFWLQVDSDASHGPTFRACLEGKTIVISEAVYHGANKQNPHDSHVLAHELGHLMAGHLSRSFDNIRSKKFGKFEREANLFAREFLLPVSIVQKFKSAKELARATAVPLHMAHQRMRELNLLRSEDEKTRVLKGFEILLDILKGSSVKTTVPKSEASADIIPFPMRYPPDLEEINRKVALSPTTVVRSKKSARQKFRELPLFEFAEKAFEKATSNVVRNRSKEWFDKYGYRGD